MKKLFLPSSLKILESLSFTKSLYAFDFDGTLAKIVRDPQDASIRASTNSLLQELAKHAPLAIVSGRSIADLRSHLDFEPPHLIGNHGLEGLGARPDALEMAHKICMKWKRHLEGRLPAQHLRTGVEIEDKSFSLALHYRKSPTKKNAKLAILSEAANLDPKPRIILGKCVVNLLPPGAPHKGVALVELMLQTNTKSALYVGDDDTDEDVFSLPNARIFTVRVGRKLTSQAQYFIQSQAEIDRFLKTVIRFNQHSNPSPDFGSKRKHNVHGRA